MLAEKLKQFAVGTIWRKLLILSVAKSEMYYIANSSFNSLHRKICLGSREPTYLHFAM